MSFRSINGETRPHQRVGWWTKQAWNKICEENDISVVEILRAIETRGCPRGLRYLARWQELVREIWEDDE